VNYFKNSPYFPKTMTQEEYLRAEMLLHIELKKSDFVAYKFSTGNLHDGQFYRTMATRG